MEIPQSQIDRKCKECNFHSAANAHINKDGICDYCKQQTKSSEATVEFHFNKSKMAALEIVQALALDVLRSHNNFKSFVMAYGGWHFELGGSGSQEGRIHGRLGKLAFVNDKGEVVNDPEVFALVKFLKKWEKLDLEYCDLKVTK